MSTSAGSVDIGSSTVGRVSRRRVALVIALPLALGACAGNAGTGEPAAPDVIAARSEPAGIAADLVYVADVDGFDLITQAVGPFGNDGMSATWTRSGGDDDAVVTLTTDRIPDPDAVACDELDAGAGAVELRCEVVVDGIHVTLVGEGVDGDRLREIAESVHVPNEGELGRLFAGVPVPDEPVERGDLPAEGDGAPDNSVGAGG